MWHRATVLSRRQLSPTVTGLTLQIINDHQSSAAKFTFLPGCWVDFRPVPSSTWNPTNGGKCIGGYSITSIPQTLPLFELAVQSSRHPVADWVTTHAQPHDHVDVRVGGSFTYKSICDSTKSITDTGQGVEVPKNQRLLFIAGGVGINPLFSMIQQWNADQTLQKNKCSRAILLYSGGALEDLLFVTELNKLIGEKQDQFRVICTTTKKQQILDTKKDESGTGKIGIEFREGRIDLETVNDAVSWLNKAEKSVLDSKTPSQCVADAAYICGPPGMPETMTKILLDEKLVQSTDNVHFEKWW